MYRTDKQFMTNPATAGSRIYIGGIPKTVVASDLEGKFKPHGKILGLVLQSGFAFIQYENEMQAQAAIRSEGNTMLHSRKITVKQAMDKSQKGNMQQKGRPNQNNMNQQGPPQNNMQNMQGNKQNNNNMMMNKGGPMGGNMFNKPLLDHPPPQNNFPPQMHQPPQQQQAPPQQQFQQKETSNPVEKVENNVPPPLMGAKPGLIPGPGPNLNQNQKNMGNKFEEPMAGPMNEAPEHEQQNVPNQNFNDNQLPQNKRSRKRRVKSKDRFGGSGDRFNNAGGDDSYFGRDDYGGMPFGLGRPRAPVIVDQPDRNDCEIIVVSKALTKYAEYIEQRLKAAGLIVDLLFPNEDVPIGRVLANISSRGCLYSILVMPQNEEHRSLTLNVLHGISQEHKNMPIEDAMVFIARNFDAYMRGDRSASDCVGPGGVTSVSDRHPTPMQLLLNLLAENRQISTSQYDKLIKYLLERKELQQQHEIAEGVDQMSQESDTKQTELQNRIMNILNKTNDTPPPVVIEKPKEDVAPPLLKDPSVQKALDSLLGGEMFKTIAGGL